MAAHLLTFPINPFPYSSPPSISPSPLTNSSQSSSKPEADDKDSRAEEKLLPRTLLDVLSNTLVLDATLPYLPLSSIFRLSATSNAFKRLIYETPRIFRYLDLSKCRGAYVTPSVMPIDSGGHNWRAQRIDENLTEDEFLCGPLRGVRNQLSKLGIMRDVQTLVLDGLGSVTHDVLSDILLTDQYNIRLLSVIGCKNLNQRKFQGLLHYLCRSSRPEGTPQLKGVYIFGTSENVGKHGQCSLPPSRSNGITTVPGAQLGASSSAPIKPPPHLSPSTPNPWFSPTGLVLSLHLTKPDGWAETLHVCTGLIAFDAVLCTHMHREMAPYRSDTAASMNSPLADYALGSDGCAGCGSAPEDAPIWGHSDLTSFPLVSPPPFSGRLVDAVRPLAGQSDRAETRQLRLVVSCSQCLRDRHCQFCQRYWCVQCYDPQLRGNGGSQLKAQIQRDENEMSIAEEVRAASEVGGGGSAVTAGIATATIKVYNGFCTQYCAYSEDLAAGCGAMWG